MNKKSLVIITMLVVISTIGVAHAAFHPIQFEKMPVVDQEHLRGLPPNLEEGYTSLFTVDGAVFKDTKSANREWLYKHTDQAYGHDFNGTNTPNAFCDSSQSVTNQTSYCRSIVSMGNIHETVVYGAVIGATKEASETHDQRGSSYYTRFHQGSDWNNLPSKLKHAWAAMCERPTSSEFDMFNMTQFADWFNNGVHPTYKTIIKNHIQNDNATDADGNPVYYNGTNQKIHRFGIADNFCDLN